MKFPSIGLGRSGGTNGDATPRSDAVSSSVPPTSLSGETPGTEAKDVPAGEPQPAPLRAENMDASSPSSPSSPDTSSPNTSSPDPASSTTPNPQASSPVSPSPVSPSAPSSEAAPAGDATPWPETVISLARAKRSDATSSPAPTDLLNGQIVQAVDFSNQQTAQYAGSEIATPAEMMISQSSGLVAQSAAQYMDGVMKVALAGQSVLVKKMTEALAKNDVPSATADGLGIAALQGLIALAMAVGAGTGVVEGAAAAKAIDLIKLSAKS